MKKYQFDESLDEKAVDDLRNKILIDTENGIIDREAISQAMLKVMMAYKMKTTNEIAFKKYKRKHGRIKR